MYIRLPYNATKQQYIQILCETKTIILQLQHKAQNNEEFEFWQDIISQIDDIRQNIIEKNADIDWIEIYDKYTLGRLAIQCFGESDEISHRLTDIFYGAVHYKEFG